MEEFLEYFFYYVSMEEIIFVLIVSISFFIAYLIYLSGEKYGKTLETAVNKARSGEELTKTGSTKVILEA